MKTTSLLDQALAYRRLGWSVIPVCCPIPEKPGWCTCPHHANGDHNRASAERAKTGDQPLAKPGKQPLVAWSGFQRKLPTELEIKRWWQRWPDANIGIITGAISGVIVLDADGALAHAAVLSRGGFTDTPYVTTGKAGGYHFYFRHPGYRVHNFAGNRGVEGLDFRGDGGYAVLPPSLHESGKRYTWGVPPDDLVPSRAPTWLLSLTDSDGGQSSASTGTYAPVDFGLILSGLPEGQRNSTLHRFISKCRGDDIPEHYTRLMVAQAAAMCIPPYDAAAAQNMVTDVYRKYTPNLVLHGRQNGHEPHEDLEDGGFTLPWSDLVEREETPVDWLVDGLFSVGSNGFIGAEPKVGKSWVGLELAFALTTGAPFLGHFPVHELRRVIYLQEEDSLARVLRRTKQIIKGNPERPIPSDEQLRYSVRSGFKIDRPFWIERLTIDLELFHPDVCILDVFAKMHLADENSQSEMAKVLEVLDTLRRTYSCCFLLVHHFRKNPGMGSSTRGNQMLRGSSALAGWAECSLYLRKGQKKNQLLVEAESKDTPEVEEFSIFIKDVVGGGVQILQSDENPHEKRDQAEREKQAKVATMVGRFHNEHLDASADTVASALGWSKSAAYNCLKALYERGELERYGGRSGKAIIFLYRPT